MASKTDFILNVAIILPSFLALGCPGPSGPAATQPANTDGKPVIKAASLPENATITLAELKPRIEQPVNKPYDKELPPQAAKALAEGQQRMTNKDVPGAIEKFERAVGFDPENPTLRRALAMAYAVLPNPGKALENLTRYAANSPDDAEVQMAIASLRAGQNQTDAAITALRTLLMCSAARPGEQTAAVATLHLGYLLEKQGFWTASLECAETLTEWIDKNGRNYASNQTLADLVLRPELLLARRGDLLKRLGKYKEAADPLEKAFKRDRLNQAVSTMLMECLVLDRQFPRAEKLVLELGSDESQIAQAADSAKMLCLAAGDKDMPLRLWKAHVAGRAEVPSFSAALASAAERLGRIDDSLAIVNAVLVKWPSNAATGKLLASIYIRQGKPREGLAKLAEMIVANPAVAAMVDDAVNETAPQISAPDFDRQFADTAAADNSPGRFALHYVAGRLAQARGKRFLAADQFQRAIESKAGFLPTYEALIDIYAAEGRAGEADKVLAKLNETAGDSHFGAYLAGKSLLARGKAAEAIQALETAKSRDAAHIPTRLLLGEAYLRANRPDDAENELTDAIGIDPDNVASYRKLYELSIMRRDTASAGNVARALLARQSGSIPARLMLAEIAVVSGQQAQARGMLEEILKQSPGESDAELLVMTLDIGASGGFTAKKDWDNAVHKVAQIVRANPRNAMAMRIMQQLLDQPGRQNDSAAVWERLYGDTGRQADIGQRYALALERAGQHAAAAKVLETLITDDPHNSAFHVIALRNLGMAGDYPRAVELGGKWLEEVKRDESRQSESGAYRFRMLQIYQAAGRYEQAITLLEDWLSERPDDALRAEIIRSQVLAGQYDRAVNAAEAGDGKSTRLKLAYVSAVLKADKPDKALDVLGKWADAAKGDPEAFTSFRNLRIYALAKSGDTGKAEEAAAGWIKDEPHSVAARSAIVSALFAVDKHARAGELVEAWIKELPPNTSPNPNPVLQFCAQASVSALIGQRKYQDALEKIDGYLPGGLDNRNELLTLKVSCLSELEKFDDALAVQESIYKSDPNNPSFCNNLGYMLADRNMDIERAEKLIRAALEVAPDVTAFQDSLAWVLYKKGDFIQAGRILEMILRGDQDVLEPEAPPGGAVIHDHAGDAYWRLESPDMAVRMWTKAVEEAGKDKFQSAEIRNTAASAAAKLKAVKEGKPPRLAPTAAEAVPAPK